MKILTRENAGGVLAGKPLDDFVEELSGQLPLVSDAYSVPADSGAKTSLARLFAHLLLGNLPVCLYVAGWGVWGSSENLDLFYGYRRSLGEHRSLIEAPVHVFERADEDAFISILSMVFYFVWDAWVFDAEGKSLVRISHDEWLEIRASDDAFAKAAAAEMKNHKVPLLGGWRNL